MEPPRISRRDGTLIIGIPVAWAVLLLFHPVGDGDFYPIIHDNLVAWQAVHVGMMIFIPLFAVAVYMLLRGVGGKVAAVSRMSLVVFAVVYGAWEAMMGVGTGVLATEIDALPEAERAAGSELLQSYAESPWLADPGPYASIGGMALVVALVTAGVALVREVDAPRSVAVLLSLSAIPITFHVPPFGQFGLALFVGAAWLALNREAPVRAPSAAQPGAA